MMDLDILDINPTDNWSEEKKRFFDRLHILTARIVDKKIDITSNLGVDYYLIRYTYAAYAESKEANTMFHKVCSLAADYHYDRCEDEYQKAIPKTKFKTLRKLLEICKFHGIDTDFEDEATPGDARQCDFLPEGVNEEFFDTYGFFEKNNQYFTLEPAGANKYKAVAFSNFVMYVNFHMNNGIQAKRIITITNIKGKRKTVDIPTDKLVSRNEFKKFCESLGNFRFFGSDGKLDMLKAYLYEQERECAVISELGWQGDDKFWAWSNGIYTNKFHALDKNGYVEINDKHFYIAAGNTEQPNRVRSYSGQIRFRHFVDHHVTFTEYASLYCQVFPTNGAIILSFAIACLFSDIVYEAKNFFPLLFIYGEGGSGKGSAIKMAQRMFGVPQDPLTLVGKANTDKSKIALFAQYHNGLLLLEEYVPNHDTDQFLKNLWDRYGYKRRTLDMGYNTESVPITSCAAITANFTPSDDPLLQRMIYLDHNTNQYSQDAHQLFNKLKVYTERGVTHCTHELLSKRVAVENEFLDVQMANYKEIKSKSAMAHCTDRMIENISVLVSIYQILSDHNIVFPFTREYLIDELVATTAKQNEKRDSGGEVQKFFDIFQSAVQKGDLIEDVHYKLDERHLFLNVKQVYSTYAIYHRNFYNQAGLSLPNLRDKLRVHNAYSGYKDSIRVGNSNTSAFLFHYDKIGIDLISATSIYKGARSSRNNMQQSYEDKVSNQKGWEPADGPIG